MNPTRFFGPVPLSAARTAHGAYGGGPITGAAFGVLFYRYNRGAIPDKACKGDSPP